MKTALSKVLLIGLAAATVGSVQASVLILGNIASSADSTFISIIDEDSRGLRFTMGTTAYQLDSIELQLGRNSSATDAPRVRLFSDATGNLGSELPSTFNYDGAVLNTSTAATGTFTPAAVVTLSASTSYWMVVDYVGAAGQLKWYRDAGQGVTPTGVGATASSTSSDGALVSDEPTVLDGTPLYHNFNLNGTVVVPEPEEYVFATGLGLLALAVWRRQMARTTA